MEKYGNIESSNPSLSANLLENVIINNEKALDTVATLFRDIRSISQLPADQGARIPEFCKSCHAARHSTPTHTNEDLSFLPACDRVFVGLVVYARTARFVVFPVSLGAIAATRCDCSRVRQ